MFALSWALDDREVGIVARNRNGRGGGFASIVRGADTGKPELTPQSPGLLAVSLGHSTYFSDDHAMLEAGMVVYDALYAWLRSARAGTHNALLFRKP